MIILRPGGFRWNCKKVRTGLTDSSRLLKSCTEENPGRKTRKKIDRRTLLGGNLPDADVGGKADLFFEGVIQHLERSCGYPEALKTGVRIADCNGGDKETVSAIVLLHILLDAIDARRW